MKLHDWADALNLSLSLFCKPNSGWEARVVGNPHSGMGPTPERALQELASVLSNNPVPVKVQELTFNIPELEYP